MGKQEVELIFIPFPITGHLLVTIELAKLLLSHYPNRIQTITILHWSLPFLPQSNDFLHSLVETEPRIRLVALPNVQNPPPMELFVRASESYILEFVKKMVPLVRDTLSTLLFSSRRDGSDSVRVAGLVLDFFCVPLIDVGNEFNLSSYIFLTCSAGFLGMMKYLPERHRRIKSEFDRRFAEEINPVPGFVSSVPTRVLPPGLFTTESYEAWVEMAERFPEAKGILVNSFTSLESKAFDYFDSCVENYPPVYPVGPILCSMNRSDFDLIERDRILRWLDEQHESSVVFLCFGSLKSLAASQIKEIAQALELVGCRFLWSIRTDPKEYSSPFEILPDGFMNRVMGHGLVCGWAPQMEILAHKAIGGFVSHCGWNSILESLRFGVPIATWPMYAEQQLNAFTIVKELGLAIEMRLDYVWANGEIVKSDEIARAVRSLMDGEDVPRRKLKEIAVAAKEAVVEKGSSFVMIDRFIDELM